MAVLLYRPTKILKVFTKKKHIRKPKKTAFQKAIKVKPLQDFFAISKLSGIICTNLFRVNLIRIEKIYVYRGFRGRQMNTIVAKVISFPLIPSWKLRRKLTLKMTRIDNYARTLSTFNKQRRAQNDSKRKPVY